MKFNEVLKSIHVYTCLYMSLQAFACFHGFCKAPQAPAPQAPPVNESVTTSLAPPEARRSSLGKGPCEAPESGEEPSNAATSLPSQATKGCECDMIRRGDGNDRVQ